MANLIGRAFAPFRIPTGWNEEERSLVRQIQDLFDAVFKRLNHRLAFGTTTKTIQQNLEACWTTAVPNDGQTYFVTLTAMYGTLYGVISRYSTSYGAGVISRYDGKTYGIYLNNGTVTVTQL